VYAEVAVVPFVQVPIRSVGAAVVVMLFIVGNVVAERFADVVLLKTSRSGQLPTHNVQVVDAPNTTVAAVSVPSDIFQYPNAVMRPANAPVLLTVHPAGGVETVAASPALTIRISVDPLTGVNPNVNVCDVPFADDA